MTIPCENIQGEKWTKLVHMNAARVAGEQEPEPRLSISSVDTELAGSNRSGKQRLLPDQAEDSGAADTSAGLLST